MANQVAQTILEQLGGRRFVVMTGANYLTGDANSLRFRLSSRLTSNKANLVKITLEASDLYTIEYFRCRGLEVTSVGRDDGVYAEQLRSFFTKATGLETSLGTLGGVRS